MKKKNLKKLSLNKKVISNLDKMKIKGGLSVLCWMTPIFCTGGCGTNNNACDEVPEDPEISVDEPCDLDWDWGN